MWDVNDDRYLCPSTMSTWSVLAEYLSIALPKPRVLAYPNIILWRSVDKLIGQFWNKVYHATVFDACVQVPCWLIVWCFTPINVNMQENYANMQIFYDILCWHARYQHYYVDLFKLHARILKSQIWHKSYVNIVKLRVGIIISHLAGQMVVGSQMTVQMLPCDLILQMHVNLIMPI